ncbi:hypothetical protein NTE_01971 [Candidatus Nitrososphaera evergladensis SR1]|uniref:Uncharacterized protein n=1 Tax=Candidatus Nitrososphaera evergladensis SR1 TaxID=1459636 RepID=A0A075MXK0_9ARCH|nr:hypothetical protein [Candidatus Nitrososphaera evergladensis]AIF84029.1 hypothetical protein NTE_01971 [Candidatus Nitrososphaera evergladensis SR1]
MALDPNVLNPYVLLDPAIAPIASAVFTAASIALSLAISWYFFRSYRFAGFGYLLGLPAGFVFLAASFAFEHAGFMYSADPLLYPAFFWLQLALQSEALALIAISYFFKNAGEQEGHRLGIKDAGMILLPLVMVALPFLLPTSEIASKPYFNYAKLADFSLYMRVFNMAVLAYIFTNAVSSLAKSGMVKMLYVPAAFALLWLEQYSLVMAYFDNSVFAFAGSIIARVGGLALFAYVMHSATSKRRIEVEARKAT